MEGGDQRELQLLPSSSSSTLSFLRPPISKSRTSITDTYAPPSLDLQLSISVVSPIQTASINDQFNPRQEVKKIDASSVESLKWQAAEQIRMAAMEKAYAERVRELSRREMEMAHSEFESARQMWQKAREEVEKAERLKERAINRKIINDSTCIEITCQNCRQRFKP